MWYSTNMYHRRLLAYVLHTMDARAGTMLVSSAQWTCLPCLLLHNLPTSSPLHSMYKLAITAKPLRCTSPPCKLLAAFQLAHTLTILLARATNNTLTQHHTILIDHPCLKGVRRPWHCDTRKAYTGQAHTGLSRLGHCQLQLAYNSTRTTNSASLRMPILPQTQLDCVLYAPSNLPTPRTQFHTPLLSWHQASTQGFICISHAVPPPEQVFLAQHWASLHPHTSCWQTWLIQPINRRTGAGLVPNFTTNRSLSQKCTTRTRKSLTNPSECIKLWQPVQHSMLEQRVGCCSKLPSSARMACSSWHAGWLCTNAVRSLA